ncbi:hypothetical protein [Hoeflea sp.]|uniref:hypothetical protein n=1 Tax=Hoeflea sp. TaxID=1940281 RepID=UPI003B5296FB
MTAHVKDGGAWKEVKEIHVKSEGAWLPAKSVHQKIDGSWVEIFKAAIEYIVSATTTHLDLSTLFDPGDWASDKDKIVTIPVGVVIGSTNGALYNAIRTGTGRGGMLTLNVEGEVQGAYGAPGSSGGHAVWVEQAGVTINIAATGAIRGGGGGGGAGGAGGTGGQGSYSSTVREPSSGEYYQSYVYTWSFHPDMYIRWAGVFIGYPAGTSTTIGGYTYYQGSYRQSVVYSGNGIALYAIYRTYPTTAYSTGGAGGAGGAGGYGQGYNQVATAGSGGAAGSAGGTNAGSGGTGGTGGAGGTWGVAGSAGATGATGNTGNYTAGVAGSAGSAGGAAGRAIYLSAAATVNNNGTIQGAVA